jgi:hypothetical protein
MEKTRRNKFVFPSDRSNKHMSDMTLTMLLRRMSADAEKGGAGRYVDPKENNRDVVPHGFRSSFKDWARERTGFANEVSEAALAHVNGDKVEAAYARGDMFDKRRKLMDAWAAYCASPAADGQVIPMRRGTDRRREAGVGDNPARRSDIGARRNQQGRWKNALSIFFGELPARSSGDKGARGHA